MKQNETNKRPNVLSTDQTKKEGNKQVANEQTSKPTNERTNEQTDGLTGTKRKSTAEDIEDSCRSSTKVLTTSRKLVPKKKKKIQKS